MLTLIKNEHKKLNKSIKTLILLIIIIVPAFLVYRPTLDMQVQEERKLSPEYRIKIVKEKIAYNEKLISDIKGDQNLPQDTKVIKIDSLTEDIFYLNKEIEFALKSQKEGTYVEDEKIRTNEFEYNYAKKNLESTKELKDKFTYDLNYIKSVMDKGYYVNSLNKASGLSYLINLLNVSALPLLYFLVLFAGLNHINREYNLNVLDTHSMSTEYTGSRFNRLTMVPHSKAKIYISKVVSMFLYLAIPLLIIYALAFIIVSLLKGVGPLDFPMTLSGAIIKIKYGTGFVYTPDPVTSKIIPAWLFVILQMLFQLLFIFTTCAFIALVEIVTKNSKKSIIFTSAIFALIYLMPRIFPLFSNYLNQFFFFTYSNSVWLFSSNGAVNYGNPHVTPLMGLIVLILSSIIFLTIGVKLFNDNGFLYKFEKYNFKTKNIEITDGNNYKNFKLNI